MIAYDALGASVGIRRPVESDREPFIQKTNASAGFLHPWVEVPPPDRFDRYLKSRQSVTEDGFFIFTAGTDELAGVINVNCIIRGFAQMAYLGYYMFEPFARRGYMTEGIQLVVSYAFNQMKLHRLEANIQPENSASIALVKRCGFRNEGFSPRYLKVFGVWKDHERWARLADDPATGGTG